MGAMEAVASRKEWRAEVVKALVLRDWTRADLADRLGYSSRYITQVIGGMVTSQKAISRISAELEVPTYYVDR